jgi:hypothetical protein
MNRIFLTVLAVFALLFGVTSEARAQGCTDNVCPLQFSASVTVESMISCTVTRPSFDFGSHLKSAGTLGSNENNHVRARCTIDPANGIVDISFPTLPASLTRTGGTETVPILYGGESARAYDCDGSCGPVLGFNPATGASGFAIASGVLTLALGENGPNLPDTEVRVDISNAQAAGTYAAVLTAQVALR